ncbi:unnamed protein product [Rhizoctonia solani]|uniref:DNA repair metallo-beta-lactamase domain-containing protein n=1 Tax=Rhizoctonia solani TaxID=456999 RepID=A0A8H3E201_9AGAM|nr:unnamed protein product [Rhizoctonia solani]
MRARLIHHRAIFIKNSQRPLSGLYIPYAPTLTPSPGTFHKKSTLAGESRSEYLAEPTRSSIGDSDQPNTVLSSDGHFSADTPKRSNLLDTIVSPMQENEADAMDAVSDIQRGRPYEFEEKSKMSFGAKESLKKRKSTPSYKIMPGMPIAVDAFSYGKIPGVTAYFLTHAHSDHYKNLSSSWNNGPIYCSLTTGNLVKYMLGVDPKWVKHLPDNQVTEIPETGGVSVTLIDANHCPGSSMFVFSGKQTIDAGDSPIKSPFVGSDRQFTYLHCGDFRASPAHALHPAIHGRKLDAVYLDTTYLNPKYCFPPQAMVIDACAELAQLQTGTSSDLVPTGKSESCGERVLVAVGTYTIGKERIIKAIASALSSKIYCNSDKYAVFMCQTDPDLHAMLTNDPTAAQVHVLPLGKINIEGLDEYLTLHQAQYDRILGFKPTGWTYTPSTTAYNTIPTVNRILAQARAHSYSASRLRPKRDSNSRVTIYNVPYSEHSSFRELSCFALSIDWDQMIATVGAESAETRERMEFWFDKWAKSRIDRAGAMVEHRCIDYW